jgi:hypothetical protein
MQCAHAYPANIKHMCAVHNHLADTCATHPLKLLVPVHLQVHLLDTREKARTWNRSWFMGKMLQLAAMAAAFCVLRQHQHKQRAARVRHALWQD